MKYSTNSINKKDCDVEWIVLDRRLGEVSYPTLRTAILACRNPYITDFPYVIGNYWLNDETVLAELF